MVLCGFAPGSWPWLGSFPTGGWFSTSYASRPVVPNLQTADAYCGQLVNVAGSSNPSVREGFPVDRVNVPPHRPTTAFQGNMEAGVMNGTLASE